MLTFITLIAGITLGLLALPYILIAALSIIFAILSHDPDRDKLYSQPTYSTVEIEDI